MLRPAHLVPTFLALALLVGGSRALALAPQEARADGKPDSAKAAPRGQRDYQWFDPFIDLRQMLVDSFVEAPDTKAMQEAALSAMVQALGDPYTLYVPPSAERNFNKELRGTYVGIGAEIDMPEGWLRVVTPLDDSPAQEAGIMPGDTILAVDGEPTHGKSVEACMAMLLGDPGTTVKLRVRRTDSREDELTLTRRQIQTRTVKGFRRSAHGWEYVLDPEHGIAYVKLTQFTETTTDDLRKVLDQLGTEHAKGLVFDLRFNGGGSLAAAIQIADLFQSRGDIVSVKGRDGQGRRWKANDEPSDFKPPMVVLVNELSASASEIVAGALQDNGRAKVLGTRTYGKGSVQDVRPLPEGRGTLKLTTARYYLPSGRNLSRSQKAEEDGLPWGVDPDPGYHIAMEDEATRTMFIAKRRWEIPDGKPTDPAKWAEPAWVGSLPGDDGARGVADPQLAAAMTALRAAIGGADWPRVGDDAGASTAANDELRRARAYRERLRKELDATDKRIGDLEKEAAGSPRADAKAPAATTPATPRATTDDHDNK